LADTDAAGKTTALARLNSFCNAAESFADEEVAEEWMDGGTVVAPEELVFAPLETRFAGIGATAAGAGRVWAIGMEGTDPWVCPGIAPCVSAWLSPGADDGDGFGGAGAEVSAAAFCAARAA
jgi:hypothetical protein